MKVKSLWIPFAVFLLAIVPFRFYQVFWMIDPATGFFTEGENLYQIFLGVLALFVLMIMLMTAGCKNTPSFEFRKNIFAGIFAVATAAAMAAHAGNSLMTYVVDHGSARYLVLAVSGILGAMAFLTAGVSHFSGKDAFQKAPVAALLLPLWVCVRAVLLTFIEYTNVTTISSNMLNILAVLGLLVFTFSLAKLLTGIVTPNTGKRMVMTGMMMVVLVLTASCSQVVDAVRNGFSLNASWILLADLALVLYGISMLIQISAQLSRPQIFTVSESKEEEVGSPSIPPAPEAAFFNSIIAERNTAKIPKISEESERPAVRPQETPVFSEETVQPEIPPEKHPQEKETEHSFPAAHQAVPSSEPEKTAAETAKKPLSKNPDEIDMSYIDQLIDEISGKNS